MKNLIEIIDEINAGIRKHRGNGCNVLKDNDYLELANNIQGRYNYQTDTKQLGELYDFHAMQEAEALELYNSIHITPAAAVVRLAPGRWFVEFENYATIDAARISNSTQEKINAIFA